MNDLEEQLQRAHERRRQFETTCLAVLAVLSNDAELTVPGEIIESLPEHLRNLVRRARAVREERDLERAKVEVLLAELADHELLHVDEQHIARCGRWICERCGFNEREGHADDCLLRSVTTSRRLADRDVERFTKAAVRREEHASEVQRREGR